MEANYSMDDPYQVDIDPQRNISIETNVVMADEETKDTNKMGTSQDKQIIRMREERELSSSSDSEDSDSSSSNEDSDSEDSDSQSSGSESSDEDQRMKQDKGAAKNGVKISQKGRVFSEVKIPEYIINRYIKLETLKSFVEKPSSQTLLALLMVQHNLQLMNLIYRNFAKVLKKWNKQWRVNKSANWI